jgi:hypothetical protein
MEGTFGIFGRDGGEKQQTFRNIFRLNANSGDFYAKKACAKC